MIVSAETGGLGNRLKCWVSAMRLDPEARVYWPATDNMPARFADLFANDCNVAEVPDNAVVRWSWRLEVLPEDERYLPHGFATAGGGAHPVQRAFGKLWWRVRGRPDDRYRYMLFPKQHSRRTSRADARHIDLEYGRIPQPIRDAYLTWFRQIDVQPEILDKVDRWDRNNLGADVIGVQVRTWRDHPHRYRKYHRPAADRLRRLMDSTAEAHRFLVVSDNDDVVGPLRGRYGTERVLAFPRRTIRRESWQSPEGVVEDLIDMLLLARTQRLFASYLSTFSEAAWWLGGARAEVTVF
jgi:hypothetical protein